MPQFSVIMPAFNRERLIVEALDSVLAQTHTDFEIIVIDDGSTDRTVDVVRGYGGKVRLLEQANAGPGAARNMGIREATGDYVTFLDSDDCWFPWTLQTYADAIARFDSPSFMTSPGAHFHEAAELTYMTSQPLEARRFADHFSAHRDIAWIGTCGVAIRRDALLTVGAFANLRINQEDCDLWLRLGTAPGFIIIDKPVCWGRREHDENVSHLVERNVQGVSFLIRQQQSGAYPGGRERRAQCLSLLTRHIRPACLECLRQGHGRVAWRLYRQSFAWNLRLGRLRFLLAFPLTALLVALGIGGRNK